jgi:hypothetical protein
MEIRPAFGLIQAIAHATEPRAAGGAFAERLEATHRGAAAARARPAETVAPVETPRAVTETEASRRAAPVAAGAKPRGSLLDIVV